MLCISFHYISFTYDDSMLEVNKDMQINRGDGMFTQQNRNKNPAEAPDEDKATIDKELAMSQGMGI